MLLRSITKHVKDQNWFAVALDFFIVVAGILIAFQITNWNDARADLRRGADFTEQLRADMRMEAWGYARLMEYNRDVLAGAERAVGVLEGIRDHSDEDLLISAYQGTQYVNHHRSRATYEELTSTGSMGLMRDEALRKIAVRLYTTPIFINIEKEGADSAYRARFRMILPNDVQNALSKSCGDRFGERGDFISIRDMIGYPCKLELSPEKIAEAAATLRSDQTLLHQLRQRISDLKTRLGDLTANNDDILDGLRTIEKEMP